MKIAVIGTGSVGRALAGRLDELGHDVTVGTRDPESTLARTDADGPSYADWAAEHDGVALAPYAEAALGADLVVNATNGSGALAALGAVGAEALDGVPVLDLSNPLDFSGGFPPTLFVKDTDSLGEQIQHAFPAARVVKALNTLNATLMVRPGDLADGDHTVFVAGDDADAKRLVTELLVSFGHTDVLDLGGIEAARGVEMYLPLWLRVMSALGTAQFNVKVVR